jgi:hypothetical protein
MRGQNILEGVVILHELIHGLHRKNKMELSLKLILRRHMIKSNGLSYYRV